MILNYGNTTSIVVSFKSEHMEEPFDIKFNIAPENGSYRFWDNLTRAQFETYLSAEGLGPYTEAAVLHEKISEAAFNELIENTDPQFEATRQFAEKVVKKAEEIRKAIRENDFKETGIFVDDDYEVTVIPCSQGGQIKDFGDIEWYLTNDFLIDGGASIYHLAADIVNYHNIEKAHEEEMDKLQNFYEEKIADFYEKPQSEWTDAQRKAFDVFSDWHKDVYGHRPHPGQNECQNRMEEEEEKDL